MPPMIFSALFPVLGTIEKARTLNLLDLTPFHIEQPKAESESAIMGGL